MAPLRILIVGIVLFATCVAARAALAIPDTGNFEGRPITRVEVAFESGQTDPVEEAELLEILRGSLGPEYSAVRVRNALQALFSSGHVANARVEAFDAGPGEGRARPVRLRFVVKPLAKIERVDLVLENATGLGINQDELRTRLTQLEPGERLSDLALKNNADALQTYLRDRGFFNAEVDYSETYNEFGTRAVVVYRVLPGLPARIESFDIQIGNFDASRVQPTLALQPGTVFSRLALAEDVSKIRQALIAQDRLAPQLDNPQVTHDPETNRIRLKLVGTAGPVVKVLVPEVKLSQKTLRELLPVLREGSIEPSAIVEGERRLRNKLQQDGYFFAAAEAKCSVEPRPTALESANGTPELCQEIAPDNIGSSAVTITYDVQRGRRFKLTEIRLEGTDKLDVTYLKPELQTREASLLGIIPRLGYGRGYTSRDLLLQDAATITTRMRDLGYRRAKVTVRQGVSLEGDNLIITFAVEEGPISRIAAIEVRGNKIYTEDRLRNELSIRTGDPFSRARARANGDRILNLYANDGYIDANLDFSQVEMPRVGDEERVKVIFTLVNEGDKVFISRILLNGNVRTKREAVLRAIPLREGEVLRAADLSDTERILYGTDAFSRITIRTEPSGDTAAGFKQRDVVIYLEEQKPRILTYGGGASTENGPLGLIDLRHVNLFGKLQQGGVRVRASANQQLFRLEYSDPRFRPYGDRQFSPLTFSLQYLRDATVTRFFRTTIDRGTFGIVQRLDEDGNPIDQFGQPAGTPTINRFTFNVETQRTLQRKTNTIMFLRYSYEDVRLFHIDSLLVQPILEPDRVVRLSRFGGTLVRDTRKNCTQRGDLYVPIGRENEPCPYSASDATGGEYLALDYSVALKQLGGNLSFSKFTGTYQRYHQFPKLGGTVLAGRIVFGAANLFNPTDRNGDGIIDEAEGTLPISERYFSGGSTSIRGFAYEEAGPRQVICPGSPNLIIEPNGRCRAGIYRKTNGDLVTLQPFTVPVGGNALAVVNLEARIPLTTSFQVVPFYDGGNVFRRVADIFGKASNPAPLTRADQINTENLRAHWTHTLGLGLRFKLPIGGAISVDYGFMLNPPIFTIAQDPATNTAFFRLRQSQLHFRFSQAF
jgi:outer membrane protein insertion porin family